MVPTGSRTARSRKAPLKAGDVCSSWAGSVPADDNIAVSFSAGDTVPPRSGHRWVWWTLGGCGTLLVLLIAAVVVLGVVIAHNLNPTGNCLPAGFPAAPNLTKVTSLHLGRTCTTAYRSSASPTSVESYYAGALDQNGWQITSRSGSTIRFRSETNTGETGTVTVTTSRAGRTAVAVVVRDG